MNRYNNTSKFSADLHRFMLIQAMEVSHDVAALVDLDGRITYANPVAGELFGCRPYEMTGRFLWDIMDDTARVARMMEVTLEHGQWRGEVGLRRQDGHIALQWRTTLIQSRDGDLLGIINIGGNLTSQKDLADRLARFERQRLLGEMAAGVAHNVNHVFSDILNRAQMLAQKGLSDPVNDEIQRIIEAANKGAEIVRRIQAGARSMGTAGQVDINAVVNKCLETTRPRWKDQAQKEGRPIDLEVNLKTTHFIKGKASQIDEVLSNLIFNAVDALPQGGTLRIQTWDEPDWVCLQVSDTGIGMDAETQARLGELFFTTKETGHGIGLATCFRTVEALSATIEVESTPDKGATFTIRFPVASIESGAHLSAPVQALSGTCKILVIDDEAIMRNFLLNALSEYEVDVAANGQDGLSLFQEKRHNMVLVDLSLPDINGVAVAQQIHALDTQASVVLMTGWGRLPEEIESHFQAFLHKPFSLRDLHRLFAQLRDS